MSNRDHSPKRRWAAPKGSLRQSNTPRTAAVVAVEHEPELVMQLPEDHELVPRPSCLSQPMKWMDLVLQKSSIMLRAYDQVKNSTNPKESQVFQVAAALQVKNQLGTNNLTVGFAGRLDETQGVLASIARMAAHC